MRIVSLLLLSCAFVFGAQAQNVETDYILNPPPSSDFKAPYSTGTPGGSGVHSGARAVTGPYDLDGDGRQEVLVTDYSGGGRVHVIEAQGPNTWELVYSTPWKDSTATVNYNARYAVGGDMDGDGFGEIIFLSGAGYSETNPNADRFVEGYFVYEHTGDDNDFGEFPAAIFTFETDRYRAGEQFSLQDIDGDGLDELMLALDGTSTAFDAWYVFSVSGDIGSGFEAFVKEMHLTSGERDPDPVLRGGGSPFTILPVDLDGDGTFELSMHSFNFLNLTNADVTGPDSYQVPQAGDPNIFFQATFPNDDVAFFGGVVADINQDGDDEVFYPSLFTSEVYVLNYEAGEDVLQVSADNVALAVENLSGLGIAAGDLDGDGQMELFGTGPHFGATEIAAGTTPTWVRMAEFTGSQGADPEDPANYATGTLDFWEQTDLEETNVDLIRRDSAGVLSEYLEETRFEGKNRAGGVAGQGEVFVSKMAYLGDADGDGMNELAVAFQGVDDSTYVIQETWDPGAEAYVRTIVERRGVENRPFMRIISSSNSSVATEDRIILPSDYRLSANYPNPFNPTTAFTFTLPLDKTVSVGVYDVQGRLVKTLVNGQRLAAGTHEVTWDGTSDAGTAAASGTYVYSLEWGNFSTSRTMVLIK